MEINTNGEFSLEEIEVYIDRARKLNPDKVFSKITITADGDFVKLEYEADSVPVQRIRRITGYLVGTLDKFNDAKRSEVEERVKHGLQTGSFEEVYTE